MCGRYYIEEDYSATQLMEIIVRAREKAERAGETLKTGEVFPSNVAPVIALNRRREKSAFAMKWGFSNAEKSALIINARSETASQRLMFRDSLKERRCLIPASGYYEWQNKDKYSIASPKRLIFMAGIYRFEGERAVFCVITTSPAKAISRIHDRMPLIIPEHMADGWINGDVSIEEAQKAGEADYEITKL